MIFKDVNYCGIRFSNLSFGAEEVSKLPDGKVLTFCQSEIYKNFWNYRNLLFVAGRAAGKSFLAKILLETYRENYSRKCIVSTLNPIIFPENFECNNSIITASNKHLDALSDTDVGFLHLEEPFYHTPNIESVTYEKLFVEGSISKSTDFYKKYFLELASKEDTLTVIARTYSNLHNLPEKYAKHILESKAGRSESDFFGGIENVF